MYFVCQLGFKNCTQFNFSNFLHKAQNNLIKTISFSLCLSCLIFAFTQVLLYQQLHVYSNY